ncbi:hypothetical protein FNV43_RR14286 [Rhamnella rubrinervis]|uniref:Uncharacterized protein n=1 Tax=Rhamnella rubrinervis TaxID=2594499 RepID=A0A8K0H2S8_9ROSA|nr:hypothetical protein FNV43_RR14286 [Rhamnella rubrinervis]
MGSDLREDRKMGSERGSRDDGNEKEMSWVDQSKSYILRTSLFFGRNILRASQIWSSITCNPVKLKNIGYGDEVLIVVLLFMIMSCFVVPVILHWSRHTRNSGVINWPVIEMLPGILKNIPRSLDYGTEVLKSGGGTFEFKGPWLTNFDILST